MFKNYLKTALRSILKHKGYSLINVIGLSIGMACCLLILMFVRDELNFDGYNEKADRIYRIVGDFKFGDREGSAATVPAPFAKTLVNGYPEVESAVRFKDNGSFIVKYGDNSFREKKLIFSDAEFFKVFSIPLLSGDPKTALKEPYTLVLSKKAAEKYFGKENPLGKILKIDNKYDYNVTGVFDRIPPNSHFHFDIFASIDSLEESRKPSWLTNNYYTYILLFKDADANALVTKFPGLVKKYMAPFLEKIMGKSFDTLEKSGNVKLEYYLQPLKDIHLHSNMFSELEPNSDIKYIYIFSVIALFILIIASINFMNLSTARSAGRAKEVGIRKVMGSFRSQLIRQFLTESMVLSFISMLIAFLLAHLALPFFNILANKELTILDHFNWEMMLATIGIILLTGVLAGSYPAFFISALQPINVFKGLIRSGVKSGFLRSGLVVFQFAISIVLFIGTLVTMNQLRYIQNMNMGYDKEKVLILYNTHLLDKQAETFKNEMLKYPQVKYATISGSLPVPSLRNNIATFSEEDLASKNSTVMQNWIVDYDYIKTLGMKIVKGRDFSRSFSTDTTGAIINQRAAKQFGWDEPVGKGIGRPMGNQDDMNDIKIKIYKVIGIVENFHYESLRDNIGPLVMYLGESNNMISFRLNTENISETINLFRDEWNRFAPGQPFEYSFLNERFNEVYHSEQQIGKIFGTFAFLSILIGCLGLVGLSAFIAEQRTKEIGIRKVLGASVINISRLLLREFIILVAIANITAWPIAYFIMNKWLQDFAYRTSLTLWSFLAAGITALIIALFTTSFHVVKAAISDPVKSIKYE